MTGLHHPQSCAFLIAATLSLSLGCSDDGPAGTGTGTDGETNTGTDSQDAETEGVETESGDAAETDDGESESDGPETGDETETGDDTDGDTDGPAACEAEEPLGDWLFQLAEGNFPNDVPENVDESCSVLDGPENQITLDCPFGEFALVLLDLSPMPELPAAGGTAQVRIHHEPGWNLWPDLWIDVEVEAGDHFAFQASSVVTPTAGQYATPWDPMLTSATCGPFVLTGPFGEEDSCGEQIGKEIEFDVDGQSVSAWHGTHQMATIDGRAFEVWATAREYLAPPQFCDVSPTWYSIVTRRESAG